MEVIITLFVYRAPWCSLERARHNAHCPWATTLNRAYGPFECPLCDAESLWYRYCLFAWLHGRASYDDACNACQKESMGPW